MTSPVTFTLPPLRLRCGCELDETRREIETPCRNHAPAPF